MKIYKLQKWVNTNKILVTIKNKEKKIMNKKLLTAALSATLVLGFGTQNVHAADTTIPAEVGDQTVNTREGGVAETARDGREEKELTKTDSTLTPADGDTKVFPAKNEKEAENTNNNTTNPTGNKETTPADGGSKVFPGKENENKSGENKKTTPADGGKKVFPGKENENKSGENKETTPANGGKKVFPGKENGNKSGENKETTPANGGKKIFPAGENNTKSEKNNKANDKKKVFPAKRKTEMKAEVKKDKEGGSNPKTGIATGTVAMTAALATAGFAVSKKENK